MSETISDELRRLIRKRKAVKSSIQSIIYFVERFDPILHSHRQLQTRLSKLHEYIEQVESVQADILDLDQGHEEESERIQFDDLTFSLVAYIEDLMAKYSPIANTTSSSALSTDSI